MNESIIRMEKINKAYTLSGNVVQVLKNIDLEITKGTFTITVGPSGAGKSTLLYLMGLLSKQDSGEIYFEGKNIKKFSEKEKSGLRNNFIGFIFQSYHLLPEFNALENVMLPSILKGLNKKDAHAGAMELLAKVNLTERIKHKPGELSGGEQQRLCICRALMNKPDIILADEPTGNLDMANAKIVIELLESLCYQYGTTLIIVTHNEELSMRSNNVIKLLDGSIVK
ncbi:MAG: hypothetical protein ACD_79C00668G0003 [uncultured bacterium]|nr:MAG: hypothetical protein ACD_79C00668G0003 [uncultured bacterium]